MFFNFESFNTFQSLEWMDLHDKHRIKIINSNFWSRISIEKKKKLVLVIYYPDKIDKLKKIIIDRS